MRYFCPSVIFYYLGGQMGDKMGDNLQISKLKSKVCKNRRNFKCLKSCDLRAIFADSMLFFSKNHFPMQKREKMEPRSSWVVISPVISPR